MGGTWPGTPTLFTPHSLGNKLDPRDWPEKRLNGNSNNVQAEAMSLIGAIVERMQALKPVAVWSWACILAFLGLSSHLPSDFFFFFGVAVIILEMKRTYGRKDGFKHDIKEGPVQSWPGPVQSWPAPVLWASSQHETTGPKGMVGESW